MANPESYPATTTMPSAASPSIPTPNPVILLQPLLSSTPTGALPQPPPHLLPHLSPILRQRVKLLASPTQAWLPLLSYDTSGETGEKLLELACSEKFEPHPVSGEVEVDVDWENGREVVLGYRRVDEETMWARVSLVRVGLWARCLHCVGDAEGPVDGWRIAEVGVLGPQADDDAADWHSDLQAAEQNFVEAKGNGQAGNVRVVVGTSAASGGDEEADEDEDDDAAYWAQYDATPAATPGPPNRSPAPQSMRQPANGRQENENPEDAYFSQYATVQPAMDGHDPDEAEANGDVESSLGTHHGRDFTNDSGNGAGNGHGRVMESDFPIAHPRPHSSSSASSERSVAVANLEEKAERMGSDSQPMDVDSPGKRSGTSSGLSPAVERETQNETAIRQHIATSVKSLYRLARAAGMERGEFRAVVERELVLIGVEEDDDDE